MSGPGTSPKQFYATLVAFPSAFMALVTFTGVRQPRISSFLQRVTLQGMLLCMAGASTQPIRSLYVHVPFCAKKCAYCAFYSEASNGDTVNRYVAALTLEIEMLGRELRPRTIFFGGGTPSLLNLKQWEQILTAMEELGWTRAVTEWTVECNPATVSLDKARLLRGFGVNRISMGVQSLDEVLLERLGRVHTRQMVFKSFDILRQAGFGNVNLDLMFAIPGQTLQQWRDTLGEASSMGSEHLSSYEVIYEEDTALYAQLQAEQFAVDEELACVMYDELVQAASNAGFEQYEIANFARTRGGVGRAPQVESESVPGESLVPEFACRHNVNYWRGGSFYGLGPSATSYVAGVRCRNVANTSRYCDAIESGARPLESKEQLSALGRAGETAAYGLRMIAGWPFAQFREITGHDLRHDWAAEMEELTRQGWGQASSERFRLTPEGLRFADAAARMFLK